MTTLLQFTILVVFLFSHCLPQVESANILVIPMPHYSVVAESNAIARELIKRGHSVTFYLPSDFDQKKAAPGFQVIRYGKNVTTVILSMANQLNDDVFEKQKNMDFFWKASTVRKLFCTQVNDEEAFKVLKEGQFDFALMTLLFMMKCSYLIPYNLKIPYASVSTSITELEIGHPVAASFVPFIFSPYGTEMSFFQRFLNLLFHFLPTVIVRYVFPPYDLSHTVPRLSFSEAEDLPKKSEIFLENSDYVLNFPKPTMPNFVQVGGLTTKAPKPLPAEIKKFFDEAPDGVIVVSFGSVFKPNTHIKNIFLSVFTKLKQRVFWKNDDEKRVNNVWMQSWLPQNDALGHSNTKLIIYHCGNNGMFESLYNAVPLLCLPLTGDHLSNAKKLDYLQIGISLDINSLTEETLSETITKVLNEPIYRENMQHLSKIFHSRPETPAERAASSVEYVMKYGSKHLRSNQNKMSPFQLLMGDVWFFIFAVITIIFCIVVFSIRKCLQFICKKKKKEKTN